MSPSLHLLLTRTCLLGLCLLSPACTTINSSQRPQASATAQPTTELRYKHLQFALATDLAPVLEKACNILVIPEPRTNTLIFKGPPEQVTLAIQVITRLDIDDGDEGGQTSYYQLKNAKASAVAATLKAMVQKGYFPIEPGPLAHPTVTVIPDARTNILFIRTLGWQHSRVINVIDLLDQPVPSAGSNTSQPATPHN